MGTREIDKGLVFYFEPNDTSIAKDQNGEDVALMPHLEDLCIGMALTADIYPRDKECIYKLDEQNKEQIVKRSLSWISYVNGGNINISKQIINQGAQMGNENYLTTYYTEISADKYIENELVEGLGVTNVNISFESWYTPTITINFVDVHGSSLWGREEAIHDNGDINSDNLLGVFFTQPYPLFRLQIKGFLGNDVTYQLSVSSFKGKYNSQTGNFEATATFIGYSYSLLTDIPLKLLSVVSEMSYIGKEYWDSKVNSTEWEMINADGTRTPPVKLYKLIEDIKSAIGSLDTKDTKSCDGTPDGRSTVSEENGKTDAVAANRIVSNESASQVTAAIGVRKDLGLVNTALEDFIKQCKSFTEVERGGKFLSCSNELIMFITVGEDKTVKPKDALRTTYQTLCSTIEDYNKKHPDDKIVNGVEEDSEFHNKAIEAGKDELVLNPVQFFKVYNDATNTSKQQAVIIKEQDNTILGEYASILRSMNDVSMQTQSDTKQARYEVVKQIREVINSFNNQTTSKLGLGSGFGDYCVVLPLGDMKGQIENIYKKLSKVGENIETKIENAVAKESNSSEYIQLKNNLKEDEEIEATRKMKIMSILGFEPTIGNFVKMLMCHLETFVEVMMHCGDKIYSDLPKRLPQNYGIDLEENTDISNHNNAAKSTKDAKNKPIWPWPALYNPSPPTNSETTQSTSTKYETLGWTNDYPPSGDSPDWEEQNVVLSCLDAIERHTEKANIRIKGSVNAISSLPMSATDLFTTSPFSKVGKSCKDIEHLAPYLGLRIANSIGVADNNCTYDIAEAIGYMDALNLIASNSNYFDLKNAIISKEGNQNFIEQVINYLTCKNSIKQTSETEQGKTYNLFETVLPNSGNVYSETRHPMFIEDNESFKYSYSYLKDKNGDIISIVPTEVNEFTGENQPYSTLLIPSYSENDGKKTLEFKPTITASTNGSASQKFVYTTKTNKIVTDEESKTFTNEQLFFVNTDIQNNANILKKLNSLKNGESKFKDYAVNGESEDSKLKMFMDRRYKISLKEYYSMYNFNKNYRILMPALSKADSEYYKEHLCNSVEEKNNTKYDTQWSTDTNSKLYKKIELRVKEEGVSFKNGDTEYQIDNVLIGELPIFINSKIKGSLFSSQIYYQQNDIQDEKLRDKAKAYLILSSMMSGIEDMEKDLFKSDSTSVIKLIPPFYVYFLGALLWRRSQNIEPLSLGEFKNSSPDQDTSFISKEDKIFYIDTNDKQVWYTIEDYYMKYDDIDISVKNKLISLFENFVNSRDFGLIKEYSELKKTDNSIINGNTWKELRALWSDNSFDPKNAGQWSQIFANMYDKYSSITMPSSTKSILRLLYNENNKAMTSLRTLYGLCGGFLVGRGTTNRIGLGSNEVTVTKEQMKGYLKGFAERISNVKETTDKKANKETSISASEVDRDYAISLYYSLKHLWDTWLITSARDQFTIKNFFNKYFIFIDSFYVNVYNKIKLNAEFILDAYNADDANLLTFISNVTSKERCMLFALPSFLDSNILGDGYGSTVGEYGKLNKEMSWKKENLRNMFTPKPFNSMGVPTANNIFVFIYTHQLSSSASENNDKKFDSYMMTDEGRWPGVLKNPPVDGATSDRNTDENDKDLMLRPNNSKPDLSDELISARYGYVMPCFGVAVNRGNNYIFKGINVNMDSPKVTSVSAQTWENILTKTGADGSKRIFFHGQDIFSIYSQYSYTCEIEMLGCAQIQPLMYFQLLNIPMWRGTYMIHKVTHSMSPGQMSTKFTGVKMSRYQAPFATGYFTVVKKNAQTPLSTDLSDSKKNNDQTTDNEESIYYTKKSGNGYPVGGKDMVENIFGDYTGYTPYWSSYDVYRGVTKKGKHHWHCGIDIMGKEGTPLYAPWDGYVRIAKTNSGTAGNYLMFVDDTNQVGVVYMHCQKLNVNKDDKVKAGQTLSWLGKTGGNAVTGNGASPHLHLELYVNGDFTMGEKKTHGGKGGHVDPSKSYGSI